MPVKTFPNLLKFSEVYSDPLPVSARELSALWPVLHRREFTELHSNLTRTEMIRP